MIVFQRRVSPLVIALVLATLVISIVAAVAARHDVGLYAQLALVPAEVWRGELWRLVTWTLVEDSPLALVFGCVTLAWFGGDLIEAWGERRFARFVAAIVLLASVGTSVVALALPDAWWSQHLGGWALGDALVIAWALEFPHRRIRIYGLFVVGGALLVYGTLAVTALFAIFYGITPFLPELIAASAALLHMTGTLRRWRTTIERGYRRRHLRVVRGGDDLRWN